MIKTTFAAIGIVATLIIGSIGVTAYAGQRDHHGSDGRHAGHFSKRLIKRVSSKLDLTAEQQAQLVALSEEAAPLMKQRREMMNEVRKEMMDFNVIGADYDTRMIRLADKQAQATREMILGVADLKLKVSKILTEEQQLKLQEMSEKFASHRSGKRHGGWHGSDKDSDQ